jgi:D-alanyl-D-alanine-carboxypeptidase/D-alanyl-D-alanine-endopeptidase
MSIRTSFSRVRAAIVAGVGIASLALSPSHARAEDRLLADTVDLTGTILFLSAGVPGLVIGVIRDGETVVRGYGEIAKGSGKEPDGDTLMRIGSITKVTTGATLASLVADGTVNFGDPLQDRLGWDVKIPERDG